MLEEEFWKSLELRICQDLAAMKAEKWRIYSCDGLIPQYYAVNDVRPRIEGDAWIWRDQYESLWRFTLLLPNPAPSPEEVDWSKLLPAENVTKWFSIDEREMRLEIEPAVAVPDLR